MYKETLSKDLSKLAAVEHATQALSRRFSRIGWALLFLAITSNVAMIATVGMDHQLFIVAAGVIGGYMALNIGANDVANNVGPAVGSRALPMFGALIIAAVFESLGAILAGGDVVKTISKGIVDPNQISEPNIFIWAMMSALLAAALWVNLATWLSAPVSTTHAVVGGVMGAGISAAGFGVVDWGVMGAIAASWVISPLMGGVIAAAFLAFIKFNVIYRKDKIAGAKRWVPVLVALMAGVFSAYLLMKGLKNLWRPGPEIVALVGLAIGVLTYAVVRPLVHRKAAGMENRNKSVRTLFTLPLIFAAALLSFAHGANDVANAVGPLAAVVDTATTGSTHGKVGIPTWVLFVGAAGITMGLLLFGPKLIRTVGAEITKMNPMRDHGNHRLGAGPARLIDPYRRRRRVRRRLLPRMGDRPQEPYQSRECRQGPGTGGRQQQRPGADSSAQAGAAPAFHDHRGGLGHHGAVGGAHGGGPVPDVRLGLFLIAQDRWPPAAANPPSPPSHRRI